MPSLSQGMNKTFIIANLKSYKNVGEAKDWLETFNQVKKTQINILNKEIIVCPSFTLLLMFFSDISVNNLPMNLGAQNLSPFDEGPYTGEVNAKQIKDFAKYVLIGHSERRTNFSEYEDILEKKVNLALKYNLTPIFCVQGKDQTIPKGVKIIAYEPVFAIGTGNPDTPEDAEAVASSIKAKNKDYMILYGGSVTSGDVKTFTSKPSIDGVLVGGASLDPLEFIKIIQNA